MRTILNFNKSRKSQNVIEAALIIPLLLLILFAVFEYGLFQRNVNAVQDIALEAAIAASKQYVAEDAAAGDPFTENEAIVKALALMKKECPH